VGGKGRAGSGANIQRAHLAPVRAPWVDLLKALLLSPQRGVGDGVHGVILPETTKQIMHSTSTLHSEAMHSQPPSVRA
jgi:hypothetical protein